MTVMEIKRIQKPEYPSHWSEFLSEGLANVVFHFTAIYFGVVIITKQIASDLPAFCSQLGL